MSSDRTKQICLWMTIYIYIERERHTISQEIDTDEEKWKKKGVNQGLEIFLERGGGERESRSVRK